MKKIGLFVILSLVLCLTFSLVAFATDNSGTTEAPENNEEVGTEAKTDDGKLDSNLGGNGKDDPKLTFAERAEYALQGSVTGMLMVFSVLTLLTLSLYLSKVVFHDIPNKKSGVPEKSKKQKIVAVETEKVEVPEQSTAAFVAQDAPVQDDGELAAVITAAIAAMLESEEYKNEFVGGFRVVSFKRSSTGAWNRK